MIEVVITIEKKINKDNYKDNDKNVNNTIFDNSKDLVIRVITGLIKTNIKKIVSLNKINNKINGEDNLINLHKKKKEEKFINKEIKCKFNNLVQVE